MVSWLLLFSSKKSAADVVCVLVRAYQFGEFSPIQ